MTWWERYFIKAIAPGMDTETQAVGTKRTRYRPLTCGSSVFEECRMIETRGVMRNASERTGYEEATTRIAHGLSASGVIR